jgi:hypothetical protein
MSISILNNKNIEAGEIIPRKTVTENGEEELELVVRLENKLFKRLGFRPTIELKSIVLPIFCGFPLTIVMLLINRDYKLLFDSIWNFYEEESKFFYESMRKQDKIKIVFINSDNSAEKVEEIRNELKIVFREYIKTLNTLKPNIKDFQSSVKDYKSKINKRILWDSPIMKIMMGEGIATYRVRREQVLNGGLINFQIEKREVESMDFERIDDTIKVFEECGKSARGKMVITFTGYDNTPLEIFEISEIRDYVSRMFKNHNNLFYFLSNEQNSNINILACLVETKKTTTNGITMNMQINLGNGPTDEILLGLIEYANKVNDISMEVLELIISIIKDAMYIPESILLRNALEEFKKQLIKDIGIEKETSCEEDNTSENVNEPIVLQKWMEDCNDPKEDCSNDFVYRLLMPNGEIAVERFHAY